jgi:hypothetical protein
MSKTTTWNCDRCGYYIEAGKSRYRIKMDLVLDDMNINDFRHTPYADLCLPCGAGIQAAIKPKGDAA